MDFSSKLTETIDFRKKFGSSLVKCIHNHKSKPEHAAPCYVVLLSHTSPLSLHRHHCCLGCKRSGGLLYAPKCLRYHTVAPEKTKQEPLFLAQHHHYSSCFYGAFVDATRHHMAMLLLLLPLVVCAGALLVSSLLPQSKLLQPG